MVTAELREVLPRDRKVNTELDAVAATVATAGTIEVLDARATDGVAELSNGRYRQIGPDGPRRAPLIDPNLGRLTGPPNTGEIGYGGANWSCDFPPEDLPLIHYFTPANFPGFPKDGFHAFLNRPSVDPPKNGRSRSHAQRISQRA